MLDFLRSNHKKITVINQTINNMSSYLKFLSRNKLYTIIEAIGLIVSIAFVILIGNYVYQQYTVAYSNPYRNRIYAVGNQDFIGLSWW